MTIEELLNQFRTDLYHAHGNLEISEQENERLKVEIQQLKDALKEERNKAIDECIWTHHQTALAFYSKGLKATSEEIEAALRKLKSDSKLSANPK